MKRYEVLCGNLSWNGFRGWTSGQGQAFWSREEAEQALEALQELYPDAVLSVEQTN